MRRSIPVMLLALVLGAAACSSDGGADEPAPAETTEDSTGSTGTASSPSTAPEGLVLVSLGDSWPEGAHCNGCQTFPQSYAEGLEGELGEPVTLVDLAGQAQPYFDTPGGGGSAGLLEAIRTDEPFREQVATGDIIVIATGANDFEAQFGAIQDGTCGGKDGTACVDEIRQTWDREFNAILDEIETLRAGRPTAIRLVNAANGFIDPSFSSEQARGIAALFEALTQAVCHAAEVHGAVCVDVRPALNGPNLDQPVDDSSQESMDAVAGLLLETGHAGLEQDPGRDPSSLTNRWKNLPQLPGRSADLGSVIRRRLRVGPVSRLHPESRHPVDPSVTTLRSWLANSSFVRLTSAMPEPSRR